MPTGQCPHCKSRISLVVAKREAKRLMLVRDAACKLDLLRCEKEACKLAMDAGKRFRIRHLMTHLPGDVELAVLTQWLLDIVGEPTPGR